jgi:hypothetical protein
VGGHHVHRSQDRRHIRDFPPSAAARMLFGRIVRSSLNYRFSIAARTASPLGSALTRCLFFATIEF